MNETLKNGLKIGGVTLLSAVVASYVTNRFLMKTALDRKMPKAAEIAGDQIAGAAIDEKFLKLLDEGEEKLSQIPMETVECTAADGVVLVGHWYHNPNAKRTIVAMHGWRSSWKRDFGTIAEFWHSHDCNVLYAEQRAQNASGGDHIGFGLIERFDCLDWTNWAAVQCGLDFPIYLAGVSMGAATVLLASELDLPRCVHGIMSDCGFTSPDAIWRHIANNNLHIPYMIQGMVVNEIYENMTSFDPTYSTVDALKNTNIPVIFFHGTDDHFVPVTMTYENYKACSGPRRLVVVPGADHGQSHYIEPERYEQAGLEFWRDFDNVEPEPKTQKEEKDNGSKGFRI